HLQASTTISWVLQTILCSWVRRGLRAVSAESSSSSELRGALPLHRFLVFLRYQCYYEYPLLTYLEYPILILQDLILLLCVFHFNGDVRRAAPYIALLVTSWFLLTLQKWIIDLAINLCTFISAASKFAQLQDLWKTKDSGVMSALTCSLASYTCASKNKALMAGCPWSAAEVCPEECVHLVSKCHSPLSFKPLQRAVQIDLPGHPYIQG
uniref:PQ-loop repeat-containing protein 3 n=1 Tax=Equus asinus asinus TaxID=83772 RepID=A0A8C4L4J4_EQUAS